MLFPFGRKVIFVVLPRATAHPLAALPLTDGAYSLRVKPLESGSGLRRRKVRYAPLPPAAKAPHAPLLSLSPQSRLALRGPRKGVDQWGK